MREIKFRMPIFDLDGTFSSFHYWGFDEEMNFTNPAGSVCESNKEFRKTQEQHIGRTDKDGVEIYEGAIVNYRISRYATKKCIVKYSSNSFVLNKINEPQSSFVTWAPMSCVVIGNIHQNPELLK